MDSLFGIPLIQILIGLLVCVGVIFGVLVAIAARNPLLVRMGVRNVLRRKTQTTLIVIGLMLSTLIISAAFATGDTVGYSITTEIYDQFGEADVLVVLDSEQAPVGVDELTDADVETIRTMVADDTDVDAVTGIVQTLAPAVNQGARLSEPQALFVGVDPATIGDFHAIRGADGAELSVEALGDDGAYVSAGLADAVDVAAGGEITVYFAEQPYTFRVVDVVQDNALTSQTGGGQAGGGGVLVSMDQLRDVTGEANIDLIVVSAAGGVRDSLDLVSKVRDRVEEGIASQALPFEVVVDKAEAVGQAELFGSIFVTFFLVFGLFSMAAGVMLIFFTFIMLAAERRAEMGMARAVGMKRLHLTESFIAEGMTYNLGSAAVGAALGLGVSYLLILILGGAVEDFGFSIDFHASPVGLLISYCAGVVITFVTVAFSSWRAANLNIVRAIRDIPEPDRFKATDRRISSLAKGTLGTFWLLLRIFLAIATFGTVTLARWLLTRIPPVGRTWQAINRAAARHRSSGSWAVAMIIIGALATWWGGWASGQAFAYTAGTTLVLFAIAMLVVYFGAPGKPVFAAMSLLVLWYWLLPLPFSLVNEDWRGWTDPVDGLFGLVGLGHEPIVGNIEMFFVSGVCITAASTLFIIFNVDRLLGSLGLLQGLFGSITPAVRTAISYPLASKTRTGMTLAMFTLVMFSLVVMATLNYNFAQLFTGEDAKGGFDVVVEANPNNRFPDLREALAETSFDQSQIEAVGTMSIAEAEFRPVNEPGDELQSYLLAGLDDEFLDAAAFPLSTRAIGYDSDEAVLEAMRTDPTLIVANEMIMEFTQTSNFMDPDDVLSIEGSISDLQDAPWEPIPLTVHDPDTGAEREVRIIGFVDSTISSGAVVPEWLALFSHHSLVDEMFAGGDNDLFLVRTAGAVEPESIANVIEASLLERGVQAESLQDRIDASAAVSNALFSLLEMFMALGLIVGIAALGVIAFRTVAERRQQIGMLRAIGYSRKLVAISFFLESSFIAIGGIGMGFLLGAALSYNLMTTPDFTNGQEIDFGIPWARLLIIIGIAYGASALMTIIPARSASKVSVAEALRYAG